MEAGAELSHVHGFELAHPRKLSRMYTELYELNPHNS